MTTDTTDIHRGAWRRSILGVLLLLVTLFAPAGSLRFWQGWLYAFIFVAATIVIGVYFAKHDPALIRRRMTVGPAAEPEPTQKIIVALVMIGFLPLMVVPGFDHRWHWSAVPIWLALMANTGVAVSFVIFFVVMKQNSYAASTIRVEADQPVISTGVYGIVRHPMYAGALLLMIATPPALGSYWGLLVVIPMILVLAWRLVDEELFLKRNLPGYAEYCQRIRYRLVPGVW